MRKTELHKKQEHGKNHGQTNIKKETVQQLSENMPPKLKHQNPHKTNQNNKNQPHNRQQTTIFGS
jgi:hypothetical protein